MFKLLLTISLTWPVFFKGQTTKGDTTSATPSQTPTPESFTDSLVEVSTCSLEDTQLDVLLEGTRGRVECSFPLGDRNSRDLTWRIRPRQGGYGVALQFLLYNSSSLVDFEIYGSGDGSSEEEKYPVTLAPLPVAHNQTTIKIKSSACPRFLCFGLRDEWFSFNVSYSSHPVDEMPVPSFNYPLADVGLLGETLYNCSHPVTVPESLKCDMIQQCLGGEDEPPDCLYRSQGCQQGWIPYQDQCVKLVFREKRYEPNLDTVSPRQLCKANYDAVPAVFPDEEGRDLVNTLYRRSGRRTDIDSKISVGLTKVSPKSEGLSHLYRFLWQWGGAGGPVAVQEVVFQRLGASSECAALLLLEEKTSLTDHACTMHGSEGYVCMKPNVLRSGHRAKPAGLSLPPASRSLERVRTKSCPDGSRVQTFYPCPLENEETDAHWTVNNLPLFKCTLGHSVHYTLVCDGKQDCPDASDEIKCAGANVPSNFDEYFTCTSMQIIPAAFQCNGASDCFDNSDEKRCEFCNGNTVRCSDFGCVLKDHSRTLKPCDAEDSYNSGLSDLVQNIPPPAIVELDGFGFSTLRPIPDGEGCPETHFRCLDGYCIPTYLLNNGDQDCMQGEDENIPKENFTCPGFYRCYQTGSCVHAEYVCDGVYHCPHKDDEQFCNLPCPANCTCEGHAFTCQHMFDPGQYPQVRYLDLSGADNPSLTDIQMMPFLHFMNLSRCNLTNVTLKDVTLLEILDLSSNRLRGFENISLQALTSLIQLDLSNNPLAVELRYTFTIFSQRAGMSLLQTLRMADVGLKFISSSVFVHTKELKTLDLRGNPIESFDKDLFLGLSQLEELQADDSRLCCEIFHRDTKLSECSAPVDELSSCSDLLRSDFFRVFLWVASVLAITGNAGVLIYRLFLEKERSSLTYRVLIMNLSLSDLLMGVYVAVIGGADAHFRGDYVSREAEWKQSGVCKMAGVLALVSSEVSAFAICLITLDRFLALRFPFGSRLRLNKVSAIIACCTTWAIGVILAVVPFFEPGWTFYGQTGICLPLPVTRQQFPGQGYSFGIFIVLNFVLFLFTGVGQIGIFWAVHSSAKATKQGNRQNEVTIARRLFLVIFTDFCCWFPVGLMGVLASRGTPIPGVVKVWLAIFVLPLNSALNPFLYTINTLRERRAKTKARQRIEKVSNNLHAELRSWPRDKVESLVRHCLKVNLVDKAMAMQWLDVGKENIDSVVVTSQTEDSACNETEKSQSEKKST